MIYFIRHYLAGSLMIYRNNVYYSFKLLEDLKIDMYLPHESCGIIPVRTDNYQTEINRYRIGLYDTKLELNKVKYRDKGIF